jgi:hypothetical protein
MYDHGRFKVFVPVNQSFGPAAQHAARWIDEVIGAQPTAPFQPAIKPIDRRAAPVSAWLDHEHRLWYQEMAP